MPNKSTTIINRFNTAGLSSVAIKDVTRKKRIVDQMSNQPEISINEVSESLNISIPKASELICSLIKDGFIKDSGKRSVGKGRNAAFYSLRADGCYFVGVEIKKYKIHIGIMGFDKVLLESKAAIPFSYKDTVESLKEIIKIINDFLAEINIDRKKISGIGISIGGRINVRSGEILAIYHFGNAPVKSILENELGIRVYLDNDSRTLAYGEFHFGNRNKEQEVLVLNLDYGIAIGIFINGMPVYGASGYAGELGHIPLFNNEIICFCGKKGCLETEASGGALIKKITESMESGSSSSLKQVLCKKGFLELEDLVEAVEKGDNLTLHALGDIAEKLGRGLAIAINIFNPELIIIGGSLSAIGEPLLLPLKSAITEHSLHLVNKDTRVVLSNLHEKASLLGTCLLVRDKILGLVDY